MADPKTTADLPGYAEGAVAFWIGKGVDANPYSWRELTRQTWHAGWMEARAEASNLTNQSVKPDKIREAIADCLVMGRGIYPSPQEWADAILKRMLHEGFVMVPRQPTEAMLSAGWPYSPNINEAWEAMIDVVASTLPDRTTPPPARPEPAR